MTVWGGSADRLPDWVVLSAAASVLLAGVVRLARFTVAKTTSGSFMGLPIPMGAMTVISVVLLGQPGYLAVGGIIAVAWLMVSRIEYHKLGGHVAGYGHSLSSGPRGQVDQCGRQVERRRPAGITKPSARRPAHRLQCCPRAVIGELSETSTSGRCTFAPPPGSSSPWPCRTRQGGLELGTAGS
nr:hypothetical protein [Microbispora rosea]